MSILTLVSSEELVRLAARQVQCLREHRVAAKATSAKPRAQAQDVVVRAVGCSSGADHAHLVVEEMLLQVRDVEGSL